MDITKKKNNKLYLIAGPCSIESETQALEIAKSIMSFTDVFRAGIWKPRTHPNSFEGVGDKGVKWLKKVKEVTKLKVATEVATAKHVDLCLKAEIDMLWLGARTTVNPFYVQEIAEALKGSEVSVFVKNPIHPDLGLWLGTFERLEKAGIKNLAAIHRGFYSYESSAFRNDPKWEIPIKLRKEMPYIPIICDPSHIAGKANLVEDVSQTAMDIDLDGLMIETHNNPQSALSDIEQQIIPKKLEKLINTLILRDPKLRDKSFEKELFFLRDKIDILDKEIVLLLNNRKEIVEKIAEFKQKNQLTIFQIERWMEILKTRKQDANKIGLDSKMIVEIFELIHKYSVLTQTRIIRN